MVICNFELFSANELNSEFKPLDVVMKESDFIVVALPHTPETKGIISKEAINSMKSNAILVNIGRGGIQYYKFLHILQLASKPF